MNMPPVPMPPGNHDWRDLATINAAEAYTRLVITLLIGLVLVYLFASGKISDPAFIKAIFGILGINQGTGSAFAFLRWRASS